MEGGGGLALRGRERCVLLMKQVPGSPSPLNAGIIRRLSARFLQRGATSSEAGGWGEGGASPRPFSPTAGHLNGDDHPERTVLCV